MENDVFRGYGIKIELPHIYVDHSNVSFNDYTTEQKKEAYKDAFLKVRETLTRIGVASRKEKNLYQSCHILHKRGEYAILHFKELFALDGKPATIEPEDLARRNRIVKLLQEWELLTIQGQVNEDLLAPLNHIKIVKHSEKRDWNLIAKYTVGGKKKPLDNTR